MWTCLVGLDDGCADRLLHGHLDLGDVGTGSLEQPLAAGGTVHLSILEVEHGTQTKGTVGSHNGQGRDVLLEVLAYRCSA
jgi:hypothetical protein